jgi:hypothetical protein
MKHQCDSSLSCSAHSSLLSISLVALCLSVLLVSQAHAQVIRNPGAHNRYSVELEPHGLVQWDVDPTNDAGFGLGMRASIPILDNGPVTTINNSLAIGFGVDWAYADDVCRPDRGGVYDDCDAHNITFPLVVQWNFFFTDVVGAFVELGLGIQYQTWDYGPGDYDDDDIEPEFFFLIGPRFTVGKTVAIPLRIGWPYFSVGVSFLL